MKHTIEQLEAVLAIKRDNPQLGSKIIQKITGITSRTIERMLEDPEGYRNSVLKKQELDNSIITIAAKYGFTTQTHTAPLREHSKVTSFACNGQKNGNTVLCISDMHHPFVHPDALEFLKAVRDARKTDTVVCLGDEIDAHALGRFPKDPDGMSAGTELKAAIESIAPFYREFPEVMVCESNHTVRPYKRGFESGLPQSFLRELETVLKAPDGWRWASEWVVDDVLYIHGDPFHGKNAAEKHANENWQSVVIGHTHSHGHVKTFKKRRGEFFALDTGCLIDFRAYAFKYARGMNNEPTLGCGVVYQGKSAEFVRMLTDAHGRWTGKLPGAVA